jgi:hypothetical protein
LDDVSFKMASAMSGKNDRLKKVKGPELGDAFIIDFRHTCFSTDSTEERAQRLLLFKRPSQGSRQVSLPVVAMSGNLR